MTNMDGWEDSLLMDEEKKQAVLNGKQCHIVFLNMEDVFFSTKLSWTIYMMKFQMYASSEFPTLSVIIIRHEEDKKTEVRLATPEYFKKMQFNVEEEFKGCETACYKIK